jgi:Rieske Fe-S protein
VEADVSALEPGQLATVEWRGKPIRLLEPTSKAILSIAVRIS